MEYGLVSAANVTNGGSFVDRQTRTSRFRSEFYARPTILCRAGQGLFWEGDEANSVFLVTSGVLHISRFLIDGRRGVIGFIFPGDMLGLSAVGQHIYAAEAVTDCYIHALSKEKVNSLVADSFNAREEFISELCSEISKTQAQLLVLSQRCAEQRVANFILEVAVKSGRKRGATVEVQMPMSRLDVADYLGLTAETVCRAFGKLKRSKYIKLSSRSVVLIERMTDLMNFACAETERGDVPA